MTHGLSKALVAAAAASVAASSPAMEVPTSDPDLKVRWDNTLQYSLATRLKSPLPALVATPGGVNNGDDGNRNFAKGDLVLNRLDLLSEFDVKYRNAGLRVSGAAWYDAAYSGRTASPAGRDGFNGTPGAADRFGDATRKLHGRKAEILDAFIFGAGDLGSAYGSFRLGRHTLVWGESLLFSGNGIASAQAPVDTVKGANKPGALAKELFMPVGQLSGQIEFNERFTVAAYSQFEWRRTRFNAAGSYFSVADFFDANGERQFVPAPPGAPPIGYFFGRGADVDGKDSGQYGLSARYRFLTSGIDVGAYYVRFNEKSPQVVLTPGVPAPTTAGLQLGEYALVFPNDVTLYGLSLNTAVGNANVGIEGSVREDAPLGTNAILAGTSWPTGRTLHLQANVLHLFERSAAWDSLSLVGEVAFNRVMSVTGGRAATPDGLPAGLERNGLVLGVQLTPGWDNVLPQLSLSVPLTLIYVPQGRGAALATRIFGGGDKAGQFSVAANAVYRQQWSFGLAYTHYFGSGEIDPALGPLPPQQFKDRDTLSINVKASF